MDFSSPGVGFKSHSSGSVVGGGVDLDPSYQSGSQRDLSGSQGRGSENSFNPSPALQNFNNFSSPTGSASAYQVHKTHNQAVSCAANHSTVFDFR